MFRFRSGRSDNVIMTLKRLTVLLLSASATILQCEALQARTVASSQSSHFVKAQPVWARGRQNEMNLMLGFRGVFDCSDTTQPLVLRITASSAYRCYVNGEYVGYGSARAAYGYFRIDEWNISKYTRSGPNVLAIEAIGYNVKSFYIMRHYSFLQAELLSGNKIILATGDESHGFQAFQIRSHVEKVERYSFQRTFTEFYKLYNGCNAWRRNYRVKIDTVGLADVPPVRYLPRGIKYPHFTVVRPEFLLSKGRIEKKKVYTIYVDPILQSLKRYIEGYPSSEIGFEPSKYFQKFKDATDRKVDTRFQEALPAELSKDRYEIVQFDVDRTGFLGASVSCKDSVKLYFIFDEILTHNDVDFLRSPLTVNIVSYWLAPGKYKFETIEPYTMKYLKVICLKGECKISDIYLREYANPDTRWSSFSCDNDSIDAIYDAAVQTFRQNSVDIFTDCPSRERGGWLCDSYFTSQTAMMISGNTLVEKNFLQNFAVADSFPGIPDGMLPQCYPADNIGGGFIPNWAMWFVLQLKGYYDRSGDEQTVHALRKRVYALLNYFKKFEDKDGLLENLQGTVFVGWSKANQFVKGVNYPTNMLYAATLRAAGELYGDGELISQAKKLRRIIREQSYDGSFFVDNAMRNRLGKLVPTSNTSETCQYYAFYFNIANPRTYPALWRTLLKDFGPERDETSIYPKVYESNLLVGVILRFALLSRYGYQKELMKDIKGYLYKMAELTGTLWENTYGEIKGGSCNHGFASYAAVLLFKGILGIRKIDYADKRIVVDFSDLPLTACEGTVPVGNHLVELRWRKAKNVLKYFLKVPESYSVDIENHSGLKLMRDQSMPDISPNTFR